MTDEHERRGDEQPVALRQITKWLHLTGCEFARHLGRTGLAMHAVLRPPAGADIERLEHGFLPP